MKKTNKIVVSFTSVVLVLILGMFSVFAETRLEYDHFTFTRGDGGSEATILAYDNYKPDMVVPQDFFGITVVAIGESAFYKNDVIKSVVLPDTLTKIGEFSIAKCQNIISIKVPAGCSQIDMGAFEKNPMLTDVDLGSSITNLSQQLLYGCSSLKKIIVPDTVSTIEHLALADCNQLEYVYVPETVKEIAQYAFYKDTNLTLYGKTGSYVEQYAKDNNIPFVSVSPKYQLGDVNLDGVVNINDVTKIQFYLSFATGITEEGLKVADVNNDGVISISDATFLQKMITQIF